MNYKDDDLLTVAETITVLRIHRSTWQKLLNTKMNPPIVKIFGVQRVRYGALREWLKQRENTLTVSVVGGEK